MTGRVEVEKVKGWLLLSKALIEALVFSGGCLCFIFGVATEGLIGISIHDWSLNDAEFPILTILSLVVITAWFFLSVFGFIVLANARGKRAWYSGWRPYVGLVIAPQLLYSTLFLFSPLLRAADNALNEIGASNIWVDPSNAIARILISTLPIGFMLLMMVATVGISGYSAYRLVKLNKGAINGKCVTNQNRT